MLVLSGILTTLALVLMNECRDEGTVGVILNR